MITFQPEKNITLYWDKKSVKEKWQKADGDDECAKLSVQDTESA